MSTIEKRIKILKLMHDYIINLGDECIYDSWVTLCVPDEPREDDYQSIAEDAEDWAYCCKIFHQIIENEDK